MSVKNYPKINPQKKKIFEISLLFEKTQKRLDIWFSKSSACLARRQQAKDKKLNSQSEFILLYCVEGKNNSKHDEQGPQSSPVTM